MSEKMSRKDIASMPSSGVDAAFDPEQRQAEKDWNDYLAHSRKTQGYLLEQKNGTVSLRDHENKFKAEESDQEYRNRIYDESLESTSRENMGLVSLAKAAREARELGDKTTQLNIEDEIQEKLIAEADKNGWTEDQRNRMLDRLLKVMDGEDGTQSASESDETESANPVDADEDVIALPATMETQDDAASTAEEAEEDTSDDETADNTGYAAAADPNPRVPLERALVPIEDAPRTQYWSEGAIHPNDPNRVVSVEEDDEAVDIDDWFDEDDSQIDTNELGNFRSAREAYINAHVNDRFADAGALIDKFAKKGGWVERVRNRIGAHLNTGGHQRREAFKNFAPEFSAAMSAAIDARRETMSPEELRELALNQHIIIFEDLEREISKRKLEKDGKKRFFSRRIVPIIGMGTAVVGGAAWAVANHVKNGGEWSPSFLGGALLSGAAAGLAAEKLSRTNNEADIEMRINDGRESIYANYEDLDDEEALSNVAALDAVEGSTNRDQDKRLGKRTAAAMAGAALAGATYGLTNRVGNTIDLYDGNGTDLNPFDGDGVDVWDGDGTDFNPVDGDGVDVFPEGDNGQNPNLDDAGDNAGNGTEQAAADANDEGEGDQDIIEPQGGVDTTETEAGFDGANINIPEGGGVTGAFQDYVLDEYGITLSDDQARDMYNDLRGGASPTDIFSGVEFYEMDADPANGIEQGDWGMVDAGPAEITPAGEAAIEDWLRDKNILRGA